MLCKVSDSYLTIEDNTTIPLISTAISISQPLSIEYYKVWDYNITIPWTYKLTSSFKLTSNNSIYYGIYLKDDENTQYTRDYIYFNTDYTKTTSAINITKNEQIEYGMYNGTGGGTATVTANISSMSLIRTAKFITKNGFKKLLPKDTKAIWLNETTISFGRLPNGIWRDGN